MTDEETKHFESVRTALAASLTDNESLQKLNDELQEQVAKANTKAQQAGELSDLLSRRVQTLEANVLTLEHSARTFKESHDKLTRQCGDLMKRNEVMKRG